MIAKDNAPKVVDAIGLTKVFRDFWFRTKARAVDNVDFHIREHEIFGLLGPNGSGKSTIIKMILGLLHKTRGRLTVFGKLPSDVSIKNRIGFLPEESYLYRFLNPRETLDYYGRLFNLDHATRKRRIDELLEMVGLSQVAHRPVGEFSKGMTRRVGLAQALINDPEFLILDEPTSGLDPIGTRQVKDLILDLGRRGKTILLSSHLLGDVEDVCDRIAILYGGKVRTEGTADQLLRDTESTVIRTSRLQPETISKIEKVLQESEGKGIESVEAPRQRLEQLFLEIVERARQEQVATSGALAGGATADFLRGETAEGEQLIESLVTERAEEKRAVDASKARVKPAEPKDDVVADLMREKPPVQRSSTPTASKTDDEVDSSVIDSLLGGSNDDDEDGAGKA